MHATGQSAAQPPDDKVLTFFAEKNGMIPALPRGTGFRAFFAHGYHEAVEAKNPQLLGFASAMGRYEENQQPSSVRQYEHCAATARKEADARKHRRACRTFREECHVYQSQPDGHPGG